MVVKTKHKRTLQQQQVPIQPAAKPKPQRSGVKASLFLIVLSCLVLLPMQQTSLSSFRLVHQDNALYLAASKKASATTRERITEYFETLYASDRYKVDDVDWIRTYAIWHDKMRQRYYNNNSDTTTFTKEDNDTMKREMKICIWYQYRTKGGMADRFQEVGHVLKKCHDERRMLFITWSEGAPAALEEFVVPSLINWTLPAFKPL